MLGSRSTGEVYPQPSFIHSRALLTLSVSLLKLEQSVRASLPILMFLDAQVGIIIFHNVPFHFPYILK